jgi:hypothetical protein
LEKEYETLRETLSERYNDHENLGEVRFQSGILRLTNFGYNFVDAIT